MSRRGACIDEVGCIRSSQAHAEQKLGKPADRMKDTPGGPYSDPNQQFFGVELRGIEPRSEPCKGPVLPFNYGPVTDMTTAVSPLVIPTRTANTSTRTQSSRPVTLKFVVKLAPPTGATTPEFAIKRLRDSRT
jgi:hypothetical protein